MDWIPGLAGKDIRSAAPAGGAIHAFEIIPALLLVYLEIAVLTAISVAISCRRLPMVVNLSVCFTVFIVGHLTGVLVLWEGDGGALVEGVRFIAGLIATVLPALPAYSSEAAIARSAVVPPEYLGWAALYTVCYSRRGDSRGLPAVRRPRPRLTRCEPDARASAGPADGCYRPG